MPLQIERNLVLPVMDPLEKRTLLAGIDLSQFVRNPPAASNSIIGASSLDDDDDDRDDDEDDDGGKGKDKGKGKGKGKKGNSDVPEITVLLGGQSLADNSATIDFGRTIQNDASPTRTFVIRNDGEKTLAVGGISLPAGFSLIDAPAGSVGKGRSTTFTVRLDSGTTGTKTGTLSFSTNDADENPFNFTIRGRVDAPAAPELALLVNNGAVNSGATLNFGAVTAGTTAPLRSFTVRNTGNAPLSISRLRAPAGFAIHDGADASLAPGESDVVTIRMLTDTAGGRSGAVTFSTNDRDEGLVSINVTGVVNSRPANPPPPPPPPPPPGPGRTPLVTVSVVRRGATPLAIADGATTPIQFGTATVGGPRTSRTFTITNRGRAVLTLGRLEVPPGFIVTGKLVASLGRGQSDQFTVAMDTSTPGVRGGQIRFTTNDSRAPVLNFSVAGRVVEAVDPSPGPGGGTASFVRGTLTIFGTGGNDVIILTGGATALTATANGRAMSTTPFNGVSKIVVHAGGGNDRVSLAALSINGTINGGPGDDLLEGSQADDVLSGGDGNDTLTANNGRDNLLGGTGDDSLTGGGGIDAFHGEIGNDTLNALDGLSDSILDGGAGTDVLRRDRTDPAEI
jgi:hypothetical protein